MNISDAFDRVRGLRAPQIDRLHDSIPEGVAVGLRKAAVGDCYDRAICREMGVNYNDIREDDIRRFTVYHAYLAGVLS